MVFQQIICPSCAWVNLCFVGHASTWKAAKTCQERRFEEKMRRSTTCALCYLVFLTPPHSNTSSRCLAQISLFSLIRCRVTWAMQQEVSSAGAWCQCLLWFGVLDGWWLVEPQSTRWTRLKTLNFELRPLLLLRRHCNTVASEPWASYAWSEHRRHYSIWVLSTKH